MMTPTLYFFIYFFCSVFTEKGKNGTKIWGFSSIFGEEKIEDSEGDILDA